MEAQNNGYFNLERSSQTCAESDLSSTSDSGCDGDDEESSAEVFGAVKTGWKGPALENDLLDDIDNVAISEFKHPQLLGIQGSRGSRKKRKKPFFGSAPLSINELHQLMVDFVKSNRSDQLKLPLLSRSLCGVVLDLAQLHSLQCIQQPQKRCLPVVSYLLKRTPFTRLASKADVEAILTSYYTHQQCIPWYKKSPSTSSTFISVVGSTASPLDEHNRGNKMLQGMGWKPGCGLGAREDGIKEPISVHIRPKLSGLGFQ